MPEFNVREVRLPELHLPEIKRDEIVRSLSGMHLPEVDLAAARPSRISLPAVGVTTADLGRMLAAAAAIARFSRPAPARRSWLSRPTSRRLRLPAIQIGRGPTRRSRRPMVILALLVAAVAGLLFVRRQAVRAKVESAVERVRQEAAERHGPDLPAEPGPAIDQPAGVEVRQGSEAQDAVA